jgi:hypothetical protein
VGLDYSYEIFVPSQNVARALTQLVELAPRGRDTPPLSLVLPGGERLVVPFTSRFGSDPIEVGEDDTLELETVIMFAVDDAIREFGRVREGAKIDEQGRVSVGYIYLTVRFSASFHPGFASLEFMAATTDMSRMFEQSTSIRTVFTELTAASDGVCCLLDTETHIFDICWLNGQLMREPVPGPRFASFDEVVAAW